MSEATVPCKWCTERTPFTGTNECNHCWELHSRIESNIPLAKIMIGVIEGKRESRIERVDRLIRESTIKRVKEGGDNMPFRKREKSNSITHLVKIVAEEVFHDLMKKIPHRPTPEEFLQSIKNDCEQAGQKWSKAEDQMLIDEVRVAIAAIARNHQRTTGAIFSRVRDQSIINCETIKP